MARAVFTVVFLSIFYLAKVAISDLGAVNGLNDALGRHLEAEPIPFTSVKQLDALLTLLVRFFQPIVTGNDLPLTLFCVFMGGQVLALHMLILIEGMRFGSRGKIISYTSAWGILWQLITIGATLPVYFLVWLWTSGVSGATTPDAYAAAISIDQVEARAITGAWTFGVLLPSIFAGLPSPRIISQQMQEVALAVWQGFPLWTGLWQVFLAGLVRLLDLIPEAIRDKPETKIGRFHKIYAYTLTFVALSYYGTFGYVYFKAGASPVELLKDILRPTSPWDSTPMASVEKGTLTLLQWDLYCSVSATWTWIAYVAYARAGFGQVIVDLVKGALWSVVVGPGGAALAVIWGRDVGAIRAAGGKVKSG
ncbi:uncharacterized protein CTRU02_208236 [Colletotrichum truncatum]|uniref:Uncharacterized protein n=1 Tax=Colletotrichum truncatum TaxID=5467 RepID=A0ACC3YX43_COLTU|nr:uncharacterized protein CTRU02_07584 [Colletotrichum truncatum]KAF6791244.1 hypothetical protein CTRU02_07584 [Colletotrichum truncatum]